MNGVQFYSTKRLAGADALGGADGEEGEYSKGQTKSLKEELKMHGHQIVHLDDIFHHWMF